MYLSEHTHKRLCMWSILRAISDIRFQFIAVKTVNNLYFFFSFVMKASILKSPLQNKFINKPLKGIFLHRLVLFCNPFAVTA